MKVFFTASQRGKKKFGKYYTTIASEIKKLGFTLIDDDILTTDSEEFYSKFEDNNHEVHVQFYKEELKKLQDAEINIFDCSFHSLSIGFIIEKSLELNKPTIVLYHKDHAPIFLRGVEEEKLLARSYGEQDISKIVRKVLEEAQEQRDKRFNFFISPRLLLYLEQICKKEGVTKSYFIRNLILEHKKKNEASLK